MKQAGAIKKTIHKKIKNVFKNIEDLAAGAAYAIKH